MSAERVPGFRTLLRDGAMIAGILLTWVAVSGVGVWLENVAATGSLFVDAGRALTRVFVLAGVANAAVYVLARGIAIGRAS